MILCDLFLDHDWNGYLKINLGNVLFIRSMRTYASIYIREKYDSKYSKKDPYYKKKQYE